ncbi:hypothetical protein QAD02_004577 [Eretmocerus hayati]|uniref:Uncharacterized protein n=1 Tax=Eretmocerus hayati TaxID=131215 RepID=A0ACC2NPY0_9HYME|nr:hypothetical protein QAD02_004577 [Eretmocerus hayati]
MAGRPALMRCFACNLRFNHALLRRMEGDNNEEKRQIAIERRSMRDFPVIQLNANSRLCLNCDRSITQEMEMMQLDPNRLRLNVVIQAGNRSCIVCNGVEDIHELSLACRVNVYIRRNIFIPRGVRICAHHLDRNGFLLRNLLLDLRYINRPYDIQGVQMLAFLEGLRERASEARCLDDTDLNDEEFECISPISKLQFEDLYAYCDPVIQNGKTRHISRRDLLTFPSKMKHDLSDSFLRVIYAYPSRQTVSSVIDYVRRSLAQRFAAENIGLESITREDYIARHVTEYSNILYNPNPDEPVAIMIADATYAYLQKSSNFQVLRQSFSLHKHRHLLKPIVIVAPDGRILCILGPYFSDSRNNDAQVLIDQFNRDVDSLAVWMQRGDIILADRAYRDLRAFLMRLLGIDVQMPAFLQRGQNQLSTEDANESRKITRSRWVVESRNGHFRSVFKFLAGTINMMHAVHLNDFYRITGAILNRYRPPLLMEGATAEAAREVLRRAQLPNAVLATVEEQNLRRRNGQWRRLQQRDFPDFPVLDLPYLRDLTVGVYQVRLAPSYVQDKVHRDNNEEYQVDEHINEQGFIRIRVYSRFRNATIHQTFIRYRSTDENVADAELEDPLAGYYCTCQAGAKTLGCCAHVASVLWFLGHARHQQNVRYPPDSLLHATLDAANRAAGEAVVQVDHNIDIIDV